MPDGRILAVRLNDKLFDKLDEFVAEENITKQKYVSELISKDIGQKMQLKAQQENDLDVKHTDGLKVWDKCEVIDAIDEFMLMHRRIPKQTEFKNENGLPSYGAAGRALEMSPAEYMKERYEELSLTHEEQETGMGMSM